MSSSNVLPTIRIAAALIEDGTRLLFVRKQNTEWFMQAGGKIEPGENPLAALERELAEEIGYALQPGEATYVGAFTAPAVNEPGQMVEGLIYHLHLDRAETLRPAAEIAEALWVTPEQSNQIRLAPLSAQWLIPLAQERFLVKSSTPRHDGRSPD